jgi:hypothetical protein|tara:strand:+ start:64 stop:339 length:276 start_codon:yes stop_codon:yes gene_type:complete
MSWEDILKRDYDSIQEEIDNLETRIIAKVKELEQVVLRQTLAGIKGDEEDHKQLTQETHKVQGELDSLINEVKSVGESFKGFKTEFTDSNI